MKFGVLGLGNWGTALANHLARKDYDVLGWCIEENVANEINNNNKNPNFLTFTTLSPNLKATNSIEDLHNVDYLLNVIPAAFLHKVFPNVKINDNAVFINATKGLDPETLEDPVSIAKKHMPNLKNYAVISGPSFAKDVVIGKPAGIVAACDDAEIANEVAKIFTSDTLRLYSSTDVIGVELGGIVKNVIAIAAGVVDGLELGDSARAGLITRGLAEMMRLAESLGAQKETLSGLSGLGDLILTATCDSSRNRQVGLSLGSGKTLAEAIEIAGSTAEGVTTAPLLKRLAENNGQELPITNSVVRLLEGKITAQEMYRELIDRPIKPEFN